jgi:hypothetical protein
VKINLDGLRTLMSSAVVGFYIWIVFCLIYGTTLGEVARLSGADSYSFLTSLYLIMVVVAIPISINFLEE